MTPETPHSHPTDLVGEPGALLRIHDALCATAVVDSVHHTVHEAQHTRSVVVLARDVWLVTWDVSRWHISDPVDLDHHLHEPPGSWIQRSRWS